MKVKCGHCSETTDITFDGLVFDDEDEKVFVSYLAAEMAKSENTAE